MARPNKQGIDYFPLDVDLDQDDKLGMIIAEFQEKGEKLFVKLLCWIYKHEGYYTRWDENVQLRFLRRYDYCGFSRSFISEVVPRCIRWGLFDESVFNAFQILTSSRIQKTWLDASRKRSGRSISQNIWLLAVTSDLQTAEIEFPAEETTQSKLKETKPNQTKPNVPPAQPTAPKPVVKKPEQPEPYWDKLVEVWFQFNKEHLNREPSFKDRDPAFFKKIIQQLKKRVEKKHVEWNEANAVKRTQEFLAFAYTDPWLKEHFLLENLLKQFDVIITPKQKQSPINGSSPKFLSKQQRQINYNYERFLEGSGSVITGLYDADFEFLRLAPNDQKKKDAEASAAEYMRQHDISITEGNLKSFIKRFSIIEFFKEQKNNGSKTIFRLE